MKIEPFSLLYIETDNKSGLSLSLYIKSELMKDIKRVYAKPLCIRMKETALYKFLGFSFTVVFKDGRKEKVYGDCDGNIYHNNEGRYKITKK